MSSLSICNRKNDSISDLPAPSQCAPHFLIAIIIGIGSLLALTLGTLGYLQVLNQMSHTFSIILISSGSTTALACLILGIAQVQCTKKSAEGDFDYKEISQDTKRLVEQGFYKISEQEIKLQNGEELKAKSQIHPFIEAFEAVAPKYTQEVTVVKKDCLDVAQQFVNIGQRTNVVLFAGPESAGGGFDGSGWGQEEQILYRSDLFALMQYYYEGQSNEGYDFSVREFPLFTSLIHTPGVQVFKDSNFKLLKQPFQIGILISAAPVSSEVSSHSANSFTLLPDGSDYSDPEIKKLMKRMIYTQLRTAYDANYETIILGAFGCGAFKNPIHIVAGLYKEVIDNYFTGAFKNIVFAILDSNHGPSNLDGNIKPFRKVFGPQKVLL